MHNNLITRLEDAHETVAALPSFIGKALVLRAIRDAINSVAAAEEGRAA